MTETAADSMSTDAGLAELTEVVNEELESEEPDVEAVEKFSDAVASCPVKEEYHEMMYRWVLKGRSTEAEELASEIEENVSSMGGPSDQGVIVGLQAGFLYESIGSKAGIDFDYEAGNRV